MIVAEAVPVCIICPPAGIESVPAETGIETFIKTFDPARTVIESDITVVKVVSDFGTIVVVAVASIIAVVALPVALDELVAVFHVFP